MSDHKHLSVAGQLREHQAAKARCAGATGSLPVSSAEYLLGKWDGAAQHFRAGGDTSQAVANAFEICAADLRRQLGLPTERQPEENNPISDDAKRHSLGRAGSASSFQHHEQHKRTQ